MREKRPKTVVTFASTSDAMAMEAAARAYGIPGRIIPVPSDIDAGCGLSWCADMAQRDQLLSAIVQYALAYEGIFEVMMY